MQRERIQKLISSVPCVTQAVAKPGSGQPQLCQALAIQGLPRTRGKGPPTYPNTPGVALTLLRRRPPPWCSGVLVSEALLAFSLLLLGSLSLIMSYWRQKRAMTPGHAGAVRGQGLCSGLAPFTAPALMPAPTSWSLPGAAAAASLCLRLRTLHPSLQLS